MTILQRVRHAVRLFRREPAFAVTSILLLALGLGAAIAMFSVVESVLLRPLPYEEAATLMAVAPLDAAGGHPAVALPDFHALRDRNRTFETMAAYYRRAVTLTGTDQPERLQALVVSSAFFDVLRVRPSTGRLFDAADEHWGTDRVVVLSDAEWRSQFHADPRIVGAHVTLDGDPYTVIGVLPRDFWFLDGDNRLVLPLSFPPDDGRNTRANHFLALVGRLRPDATQAAATADLAAVNASMVPESPTNRQLTFTVTPLQEVVVANIRLAMLVFLAAITALLLIGCANLTGLAMARAVSRRRDAAIRLALGATPLQLAGQRLVEAGMLAALGGAIGSGLAVLVARGVRTISPTILPRASQVRVDGGVLLVAAGLAALAALTVALMPTGRNTSADVRSALGDGRAPGADRGHVRLRGLLVVGQTAFAVVLLVAGGLMVRSLLRLTRVDLGFDPRHVLTFGVALPPGRYLDTSAHPAYGPAATIKADQFFREAIDRIRLVPGVRAVGATALLPAAGMGWDKVVTLWDRPLPSTVGELPGFEYRPVAGDYFAAMGIALIRGRVFTDEDTRQSAPVVLVNREFVRRHFGGRDEQAIGTALSLNPPRRLLPPSAVNADTPEEPERFTIVGVVADARNASVTRPADPMVYAPYAQGAETNLTMSFAVRTSVDPAALAPAVRHALWTVDRGQPLANVRTMDDILASSVGRPEVETDLLAAFGVMALVLAAFGVHALMAFGVAQRRREIGVRIALGGRPAAIAIDVVRQGAGLTAAGVVIGSGAAALLARTMRSMVFGVDVLDPAVFAGVGLLLVSAAVVAALVPAIRAARVDPLVALRE